MVKEMENVKLTAEPRSELGSVKAKGLRRDGMLPCVVYNSEGQSQAVKINRHSLELLVRKHGGHNVLIDLELTGQAPKKVLLKEIQRDCVRDCAMHVDFQEVSMTRKLRVQVDIRLVGEPMGVTQAGGVLEHHLRTVEIECLPMDIVRELDLDVSAMNIGDSIFVRDIKLDAAKQTLVTDGGITVASVQMPAVEEEVKPAAEGEAAAEGAEGAAKEGDAGAEKKEGAAAAPAEGDKKGDKKEAAKGGKDAGKGAGKKA